MASTPPARLTHEEAEQRLPDVLGWGLVASKLHREFEFANFVEAFGFMAMVALSAERLNHHPEWSNSYHRVVIDLQTHDVGGLSELDFALARAVNTSLGE
jgi:4a-hydroxytetrahydrobiopterin dehydratase